MAETSPSFPVSSLPPRFRFSSPRPRCHVPASQYSGLRIPYLTPPRPNPQTCVPASPSPRPCPTFSHSQNYVPFEQCRSIFPWLVPLVSDQSVRHYGKHPQYSTNYWAKFWTSQNLHKHKLRFPKYQSHLLINFTPKYPRCLVFGRPANMELVKN